MKFILPFAFFLGTVFCAPSHFKEFDIHHAPAEAAAAIPAGIPAEQLEVLLPVDANNQVIGGVIRGFIKQDIPKPNGQDEELYYPFGFEQPAAAAPAAPAAPAAAAPAAPAAPVVVAVVPVVEVAPAAPTSEEEED